MTDPNAIARVAAGLACDNLSDQRLLERFAAERDETAFATLVQRYGRAVLDAALAVLRHAQDAEDVFQAAFLVLARKASAVRKRDSVGCWLHGVARRIALKVRRARTRRTRHETAGPLLSPGGDDLTWGEVRELVHEELARLPEATRAPLLLCYMEGLTQDEAAARLGLPKGTLKGRLERGRETLRRRLARRGLALAAVAFPASFAQAIPPPLVLVTARHAARFAAGPSAAGAVPARAASLANGALHTMTPTYLKLGLLLVVTLGAVGLGVAATEKDNPPAVTTEKNNPPTAATAPRETEPPKPATSQPPSEEPSDRGNVKRPDFTGRVVKVRADGKSFTAEGVATERPAESTTIEVKIGEKTAITYDGVTTNGAKPTEGYVVSVWMDNAEKGLAARVGFGGVGGGHRGSDLTGTVVGVDKDGKGITLELSDERTAERGVEKKKERLRFNDKTVLVFSDVAEGKAEIAVNQTAWVWYDDSARVAGNRIAGQVQFFGSAVLARHNRSPDVSGKLLTATDKSLTIEQPAGPRGGEPKKVVIKIGEKCSFAYHNVGPGGAKPVEGKYAQVWFENGSKETADEVALSGEVRERWVTVSSKVVGVAEDNDRATITLEQPSAVRGGDPKRVEMKITNQTRISYSNVGPDGAKPTVGYLAHMRLIDDSKDTVSHVTFTKTGRDRGR